MLALTGLLVSRLRRSILLQTEMTRSKHAKLLSFEQASTTEVNRLLSERGKYRTFNEFWHGVGSKSKNRTGFNSQVVCDLARSTWRKQTGCTRAKGITVKFNIPRNCKIFKTRKFTFVELGLYPKRRMAIPIKKTGNWGRFNDLIRNGWVCKTYGLTPKLQIVAYLTKAEKQLLNGRSILGVDMNSKCFALSVLSTDGKVLKQCYLGKDIWNRRRHIFKRKSMLQSYADTGSHSAQRKLEQTKTKEHNFVKNRIGEVVRDVTNLALKYDADIAIEKLKRFKSKGKRFNQEAMRIPFYAFRKNLGQRCFDKGVRLNVVDGWHTSKWCSHCGAVGKGHSANYAMFKCKSCGQIVNSDRKASLAIAAKSLLERNQPTDHSLLQFSSRRVPVNGLMRRPDAVGMNVAVQGAVKLSSANHFHAPIGFICGRNHRERSHQSMKPCQWRYVGFGPKEPTRPMLGNWLLDQRKTPTCNMV